MTPLRTSPIAMRQSLEVANTLAVEFARTAAHFNASAEFPHENIRQLSGNHGVSRNNPLARHHRDGLCSRIHSPQEDAVRSSAGRLALGL